MPDPPVSRIGRRGGGMQWKEEDRRGGGREEKREERERERMGEHVARVIYFYVSRTLVRFN